jgi:DNA-binding HxlR family transcriptional regulator
VEYRLTKWGQALCPALDGLLKWAELRDRMADNSERTLANDKTKSG